MSPPSPFSEYLRVLRDSSAQPLRVLERRLAILEALLHEIESHVFTCEEGLPHCAQCAQLRSELHDQLKREI